MKEELKNGLKRALAIALSLSIANPLPLYAAATDISSEPLAQPASNVKPNIMLLFDDSGSMKQQYTPDYANDSNFCWDSKDSSSNITGSLRACSPGDPVIMSPDLNTQYYSPEIRYSAGVNYDGSSRTNMTAANTTNWTVVPTDNIGTTSFVKRDTYDLTATSSGTTVNNVDLVSAYPDRLWCYSQSDTSGSLFTAADVTSDPSHVTAAMVGTARCRKNSSYSYPDDTFGYGNTTSSAVKYTTGGPYYYRIEVTEYCSDVNLTTCTASTVPTGIYIYPARVRYCTGSSTSSTSQLFSNCISKYRVSGGSTYHYPKFLGTVVSSVAGNSGKVSFGTITVSTQKDNAQGNITGIFVNGVNVSGAVTLTGGQTTAQWATAIMNAINTTGASTTPQYHATCTGGATCTASSVTVRYGPSTTATPTPSTTGTPAASTGTPGTTANGYAISLSFNVTGTTAATSTATISGASQNRNITAFSVGGNSLIASSVLCPNDSTCGGSGVNKNSAMAIKLRNAINAYTATSGYTASIPGSCSTTTPFSSSGSCAVVTITAPSSLGSSLNGTTPASTQSSGSLSVNKTALANGVTTGDMDYTTAAFGSGVDVVAASVAFRQDVGTFTRVDIVPFQDPPTNSIASTFTKYPDRDDCITTSGVCTYDEEMTNFANWYSYYRTRTQMAKTAIGRAFVGISNSFRVGFATINLTSTSISSRFLAIADFDATAGGQKQTWYSRLYGTGDNGSTPNREALSRVGQYYAGVSSTIKYSGMGSSPIQVACQPNYTILVTDGYWNQGNGQDLSGSAIGNYDNTNSGYSLRTEARYDGNILPTTVAGSSCGSSCTNAGGSGTLADVAMYYYKTDLRSDLSDLVPVTSKDPAPHQHMTTFTVGLGLAGQLNFDSGYENGSSADFERLKIDPASGGLDWPSAKNDDETALDDLWHAAVNGRGTFFSAKDPTQLATSISQTLSSVSARVGAGAAAATSNLQPVAGDNFAFTAQYETVTWIGDLKARTIDLSTGTVASRQLWSAATSLDGRDDTSRNIYTLDASDNAAPGTGNGNKLKSFCYPAAMSTAAYPTCTDGAGLSTSEMLYFDPQAASPAPGTEPRLAQSTGWSGDGSGRDATATKESLVDYLRGNTSQEDTGASSPSASDLYRARTSRLGDIINAQPAYVKNSPFSYNTGSYTGTDPYYAEYKATTDGTTSSRKGTVFVAANDGMLHALETDPDNSPYYQTSGIGTSITTDDAFTGTLSTNAITGEGAERWAYIPGLVVPYLKRIADSPYSHRYFTDGSPVVGDVCFGHTTASKCSAQANWRTILVSGLNGGGRGYYALDVTDPDNPKALWEFKGGSAATNCGMTQAQAQDGTRYDDCNMGYSFGNPLIVKRKSDGKWVVIFSSGYNNYGTSAGDGKGYLYVVNAQTGVILQRMTTGVGCDGVSTTAPCTAGTVDPSGLGKINAWVDNASFDNTALTIYGGDLKGNLWRFELDGTAFPTVTAGSVTRLATLVDSSNAAQPITTKPELGKVNGSDRAVFIGTGEFLGTTDKSSIQRQSFYAIKDAMSSITSPVLTMTRSGTYPSQTISGFTRQTLQASASAPTTERTTAANTDVPFQSPTQNGWFIDFPDGGTTGNPSERVNVDPILQLGTLVVPSNVPNSDACVAGGYGWINFLDYKTGTYIVGSTNNMASQKISSSLVVGINVVQLPGGTIKTIVTTADNQQLTQATPVGGAAVTGRRVSWRELFFE